MKRIIFSLAIALSATFAAVAQTDTTRTENTEVIEITEEVADSSDFSVKESYNYLIRAQVEETSLIKVGFNNFAIAPLSSYMIFSAAYERKLKPSLSVLIEAKERVSFYKGYNAMHSVNFGARHYYNMNKRIRKGKSANNFSANYIGIYQQNALRRYIEKAYYYEPAIQVIVGLQRRLGKYGYVDFYLGPGYEWQKGQRNFYLFNSGISIGLAF